MDIILEGISSFGLILNRFLALFLLLGLVSVLLSLVRQEQLQCGRYQLLVQFMGYMGRWVIYFLCQTLQILTPSHQLINLQTIPYCLTVLDAFQLHPPCLGVDQLALRLLVFKHRYREGVPKN